MNQILITKTYKMNLAHFIKDKKHSEALHGHTYRLEVCLKGKINHLSGFSFNLKLLDEIIHENILKPYNKSLINEKIPFSSGEYLSSYFFKKLKKTSLKEVLFRVSLQETRKNRFYFAS